MTLARGALVGLLVLVACGNHAARTGGPATSNASTLGPDPTPHSLPYLAAAPMLGAPSGGPVEPGPACTPQTVQATARTVDMLDGVAGVITFSGKDCQLHIRLGPTSLLDAAGHPLPVELDSIPPLLNPADNARPDLTLSSGQAIWGFTWTGSWCGPRATTIVVPMNDAPVVYGVQTSYGDLHVPLTGPLPACHGRSDSILRPGVPGRADEPVLPAPPAWAPLRAAVSVPTATATGVPPYTMTLTNSTSTSIPLSPCPAFGSLVAVARAGTGSPSGEDSFGSRVLRCPSHAEVPAHGSLTLQLPAADFGGTYETGSLVTVQVAIAGVGTASATTHVG